MIGWAWRRRLGPARAPGVCWQGIPRRGVASKGRKAPQAGLTWSLGGTALQRVARVLVIGGGPAGLAAAIAARKRGFSVTVADGSKPPIDKACGEGLLPGTLAALRELGVSIPSREGEV